MEHEFIARHAIRLADGGFEDAHEHTWRVTAIFQAEKLDEATGVVIDFVKVQQAMASIAADLDGRDLNTLPELAGASGSAERVAEVFAGRLIEALGEAGKTLVRLAVTEAAGCSAAFYPNRGRNRSAGGA
ncbi:MAG: 6-carboxytetrahydropterin synthase [Planctomycetota bacterium]|nr:6-carboxytetrahydropterin synthase [Planctomycetota bacterium]